MPSDVESKVEFVSNLEGTSLTEVVAIGSAVPIAILLHRSFSLFPGIATALPEQILDYATVVVVPLAAMLLDSNTYSFLGAAAFAGVALTAAAAGSLANSPGIRAAEGLSAANGLTGSRKLVFSYFRAGLMLLTCCAILAVDFRVFPRRLAKAETYGIGLMDVGPGAFVFAQGLVVGARASDEHSKRRAPATASRAARAFTALTRGPLPLLLLGAARLASTSAVGYQVHVGEYGAHWNFFVTLSAVAAAAAALGRAPRLRGSAAAGCALLAASLLSAHQLALSGPPGLARWVNREERDPASLLDLNKEGVASSVGYVSLYYAGAAAGAAYARGLGALAEAVAAAPARGRGGGRGGAPRGRAARVAWAVLGVWGPAAVLWGALWALTAFVEPISRRSANAPYCVFISAFCCLSLAELATLEAAFVGLFGSSAGAFGAGHGGDGSGGQPRGPVRLLVRVNDNLLLVFLAANLMTGAVNLSMDTLGASDAVASGILLGYMALVCAAANLLAAAVPPAVAAHGGEGRKRQRSQQQ